MRKSVSYNVSKYVGTKSKNDTNKSVWDSLTVTNNTLKNYPRDDHYNKLISQKKRKLKNLKRIEDSIKIVQSKEIEQLGGRRDTERLEEFQQLLRDEQSLKRQEINELKMLSNTRHKRKLGSIQQ